MFGRIVSLALALCGIALPVSAAPYPDHPIRMIVPFAAGGGTDMVIGFDGLMSLRTRIVAPG